MFIAVLLPMLWVGRRVLLLSAALAGVGVGLFIDEVGKFLTTSNDYFFAPAAPIIYGGILLLVLLWLLVRRRGDNAYDATQAVIEALRDGVDGHLTDQDRSRVIDQVHSATQAAHGAVQPDPVTDALIDTLRSPAMDERLAVEGWVARGDARRMLERFLSTRVERWLIIFGLVWTGVVAGVIAVVVLAASSQNLEWIEEFAADSGRLEIPSEPVWILLLLAINAIVGLGCAAALVLLRRGRRRTAMNVAIGAVLIGLVAGGLVGFYAVQLGALTTTLMHLALLGLLLDQRIRLERAPDTSADHTTDPAPV